MSRKVDVHQRALEREQQRCGPGPAAEGRPDLDPGWSVAVRGHVGAIDPLEEAAVDVAFDHGPDAAHATKIGAHHQHGATGGGKAPRRAATALASEGLLRVARWRRRAAQLTRSGDLLRAGDELCHYVPSATDEAGQGARSPERASM